MDHHVQSREPRSPLVPPGGGDLHARDMTATFSADVTLAEAQRRLAEIGQWLPIDGDPDLSVGRLLDENSTGPLRLGYGAWRDLLLGVQFNNGRGELITAGGRTVKNVAGYDLTKFMVGQRGVFGRLLTLTTRTYRRPAGAISIDLPPAPLKINELLPTPLRPQWAALTATSLRLGYFGDERTLDFYRRQLPSLSPTKLVERSVDDDIADRRSLWVHGDRTFRATVPPAKLLDFVAAAGLGEHGTEWAADAAFGVVVGATPADIARLTTAANDLSGRVLLLDRSVDTSSDTLSSMTAQEREIVNRLKRAFDEGNTLSPIPSNNPIAHGRQSVG